MKIDSVTILSTYFFIYNKFDQELEFYQFIKKILKNTIDDLGQVFGHSRLFYTKRVATWVQTAFGHQSQIYTSKNGNTASL